MKVGPGKYELEYQQTERRVTGLKYQQINEKNDRTSVMSKNMINKEIFKGMLNVNWDYLKPNKLVFQYHQDSEWGPKYIPLTQIYQEHWKYYDDYNLDRVKQNPQVVDFAQNKHRQDFLIKQKEYKSFIEYMNRLRVQPQLGEYQPDYRQVDKHVQLVDFDK